MCPWVRALYLTSHKKQLLQSNSHVTVRCGLQGEAGEICFHDVVEARVADIPCQLQNSQARGDMGHAAPLNAWQQERELQAKILTRYQGHVKGCQDVCAQWPETLP